MRTDLPNSMVESSFELSPDAKVTLFHIELQNLTEFYLSPTIETSWQGDTYEKVPCSMTSVSQEADGRRARPKFSVVNPGGMFSAPVAQGEMDNAFISRIEILKADLDANLDFAKRERFRVSKIVTLNKDLLTVELRDVMDGHNFTLPARAFYPPEFPHVKV